MDPAMAEPTRFFDVLRSTRAEVDVFRTDLMMWAGTMASATTDLPRPSTQFTAAGFLSVQKLPDRETTCRTLPLVLELWVNFDH